MIVFKQTNYNFSLLYARRSLLNIIRNWPKGVPLIQENNKEQRENLFKFFKIIANEAIYSSNELCNRKLVFQISDTIQFLLSNEKHYVLDEHFVDDFISSLITGPIDELKCKYLDKNTGNFSHTKSTGEQSIENPNIEIALWLIQVIASTSKTKISIDKASESN